MNGALIIHFQDETGPVRFSVRTLRGCETKIADNEPLKAFDNRAGGFSPAANINLLLQYIDENFDGSTQAELILEGDPLRLDAMQSDVATVTKAVESHNNQKNAIQISFSKRVSESSSSANECPSAEDETQRTKVAFIGKIHSGKTELITACLDAFQSSYTVVHHDGYVEYAMADGSSLFEINGIDLGRKNFTNAAETLNLLGQNGLTHIVYCFYAMTGKMEDIERDFIHDFQKKCPNVKTCASINMSLDQDTSSHFASIINNTILNVPVFVTLAKEAKTKMGFVAPYGVTDLVDFMRT